MKNTRNNPIEDIGMHLYQQLKANDP